MMSDIKITIEMKGEPDPTHFHRMADKLEGVLSQLKFKFKSVIIEGNGCKITHWNTLKDETARKNTP